MSVARRKWGDQAVIAAGEAKLFEVSGVLLSMKQLFAVALVVVAAPACAQHGGGGHGGGGGGFHGGGVTSRGGFAAPGGFAGGVNRGAAGGRMYVPRYGMGGGPVVANARPSFYHGGWRRGYVAPYGYGYGVGVGYVGYGGPGYGCRLEGHASVINLSRPAKRVSSPPERMRTQPS